MISRQLYRILGKPGVYPRPSQIIFRLIVTFLTFQTSDVLYGYLIPGTVLQLLVVELVGLVVFIILELYFCLAVTVDTPAHCKV